MAVSFTDPPPPAALHWVERSVGRGAHVRSAEPLAGATSTAVHGVDVEHRGATRRLVLRRFTWRKFLDEEADRPGHEAAILSSLAGTRVPAPRLVAVDRTGEECDVPAILTDRLPGTPALPARGWAEPLAEAAMTIHHVPADGLQWGFERYNAGRPLAPPAWTARSLVWERAFEVIARPAPGGPDRFIHRDYHHHNVLWEGGRLSGVVDWLSGCAGPPGIDVARCRLNLWLDHGREAGDRFLAVYRRAAGSSAADHPYWDLVDAVDMLPFYDGQAAVDSWPGGLEPAVRRERLESFIRAALTELG